MKRVSSNLDQRRLEHRPLAEDGSVAVDLDVADGGVRAIGARSDNGGGLRRAGNLDGRSSGSGGHAERGEGLALRGELNRVEKKESRGRTEENRRPGSSGVEEGVDVEIVVRAIQAVDCGPRSGGNGFRGEFFEVY